MIETRLDRYQRPGYINIQLHTEDSQQYMHMDI